MHQMVRSQERLRGIGVMPSAQLPDMLFVDILAVIKEVFEHEL